MYIYDVYLGNKAHNTLIRIAKLQALPGDHGITHRGMMTLCDHSAILYCLVYVGIYILHTHAYI